MMDCNELRVGLTLEFITRLNPIKGSVSGVCVCMCEDVDEIGCKKKNEIKGRGMRIGR